MKTILAKSPHDSSFSLSKRYFSWRKKIQEDDEDIDYEEDDDEVDFLTRFNAPSDFTRPGSNSDTNHKKKKKKTTISKLRHALTIFNNMNLAGSRLGNRVVGTLFGHRRGHIHFAVQDDPTRPPVVLIQLPTSTSALVREMASGLVRIALECEKKIDCSTMTKKEKKKMGISKKLLDEPIWRTYCNGKKCGFATRRECNAVEWRMLAAVGPITMGAGVLPAVTQEVGNEAMGSEMGEVMYMRARFERVIGSHDSEAFYMMNPDGTNGGPELSVYFLRV